MNRDFESSVNVHAARVKRMTINRINMRRTKVMGLRIREGEQREGVVSAVCVVGDLECVLAREQHWLASSSRRLRQLS